MCKMPARKIPLVWSSPKQKEQINYKYDPTTQNLVRVDCCGPTGPTGATGPTGPTGPCDLPEPVVSVELLNLIEIGASVSWVYPGTETFFEVNIYEGASLPVDTSGTPLFSLGGPLTSPYAASFTPADTYYYVASVRVKNDCGYSTYVYSDPVQYTETVNYQFVRVSGTVGVNPGSGNFSSNITSPPTVVVQFNKTDKNSLNASSYLSALASTATTFTITKDLSNYSVFTLVSSTDSVTYWIFTSTISSFLGIVNVGDTVTLSYT